MESWFSMGILLVSLFVSNSVSSPHHGKRQDDTFISDAYLTFENEGYLWVLDSGSGVWGTVCDDWFEQADAQVACRMMGMEGGEVIHGVDGLPEEISRITPILLDNVECQGDEPDLNMCEHNGVGEHNCNHAEDVAISCSLPEPTYSEGQIRLVDGATEHEGRLEIFHDGVWGNVCDDFFDGNAADVVCWQLHYQRDFYGPGYTGGETYELTDGRGSSDGGQIWLDNVVCQGPGVESTLADCSHNDWGDHNCAHHEDISVRCLCITLLCKTILKTAKYRF